MMNFLQKFLSKFERYQNTHNYTCDFCAREVFSNERICSVCNQTLPWNNGAICPFCGRKVGEAGPCLECKEKPLKTEKARSAFVHEGEAMRFVLRFKRGEKYLAYTGAKLLLPIAKEEFPQVDLIAFVPMTKKAVKKRGYNQSELLAGKLAELLQKPLFSALEKRKETAAQKTLGRKEREENLQGCFRVTEKKQLQGKNVLIVDDTMTTGSTSSELAGALKKAGAKSVFLLTVTSVPRHDFSPERKNPKQVLKQDETV